MQAYKMHARERDTSVRYCYETVGVVGSRNSIKNSTNVRPSCRVRDQKTLRKERKQSAGNPVRGYVLYKQSGLGGTSDSNPTLAGIGSGGAEQSIVPNDGTRGR